MRRKSEPLDPLFVWLLPLYGGKQLLDLYHHVILKPGGQIIKKAGQPLEFFRRGCEIHVSRTVPEPILAYPKGQGYKVDDPVVDFLVCIFKIRRIAITNINRLGKLSLGHL